MSILSNLFKRETPMASFTTTTGRRLTVLVTGCDSGFGYALVHKLHNEGYRVIACCQTERAAQDFENSESINLRGIQLDVTKTADINRVRRFVEEECASEGLYCLVNNAGVNLGSFIDFTSTDKIAAMMEVNYMGTVRMCKALVASLRKFSASPLTKQAPRIVNMTSAAAVYPIPLMGGYCASKHATESFSTSLRYELQPWDIRVVTIQPGFMQTPLVKAFGDTFEDDFKTTPDDVIVTYKSAHDFIAAARKLTKSLFRTSGKAERAVDAMMNAVIAINPKIQSPVGFEPYLFRVFQVLPNAVTTYIINKLLELNNLIAEPAPGGSHIAGATSSAA